jgi:hypothetical protein
MALQETFEYSDEEWVAIGVGRPLAALTYTDLYELLSRWTWAQRVLETFQQAMSHEQDDPHYGDEGTLRWESATYLFMFLWFGLLWALVEALTKPAEKRGVRLSGRLADDVETAREPLKKTRHAVFHIPRPSGRYPDPRLVGLMEGPTPLSLMLRIHNGIRRLLQEELDRRPESGLAGQTS